MGDVIQFPGAQRALPGLTAPAPAQTVRTVQAPPARVCWHCAGARGIPKRGEKFCTPCQLRGEDSPLVPCRHDQCNTVAKRRWPGQQFFDCGRHGQVQNEKAAFDLEEAENV